MHQLTKARGDRGRAVRHPRATRSAPRACRSRTSRPPGAWTAAEGGIEQIGADASAAMHPLGKPITAEDCAEAAVFLASDRAANITGVLLPVDGGYVAR